MLEAALERLEPRPRGWPSASSAPSEQRCIALEQRVAELEADLKITTIREEVAQFLEHYHQERNP